MEWIQALSACKGRTSKKIGNNTYMEVEGEGDDRIIYLRLHSTRIIAWKPDNSIVLNSGGWRTVTTKARLNDYMPFGRLYTEKGIWYYALGNDEYKFEDGMILKEDRTVLGAKLRDKKADSAARKEKKTVAKYCREYVEKLFAGKIPAPSGGDCWFCSMFDSQGFNGDPEHIRSHIFEETYYVPSLLVRAIEMMPVSPFATNALAECWSGKAEDLQTVQADYYKFAREQLQKVLYRYICRRFGYHA